MGTVVVSLDAELAWGFHDVPGPPRQRFVDARAAWRRLLDLFDRYRVPATWSVVGHLFLDDCDCRHRDHPTPGWWFPCPQREPHGPTVWYGDGLLEAIGDAEVAHEIGCHSFSHVPFTEPWATREVADAELRASAEAAEAWGLATSEFRSVTFPRNQVAHREVLVERGFDCYRGPQPPWWYDSMPFPLREAGKLLDLGVGSTPPIVQPRIDEYGLVNVPASLYLFVVESEVRARIAAVRSDPVFGMARRAIDRVADGDGVFHLWLHPNDYVAERDFVLTEAILAHLARRREETDLAVRTMGALASEVLAGEDGGGVAKPGGVAMR